MDLTRRRALITGVTTPDGIAMAVARALGHAGYELILAAPSGQIELRRAEVLAEGHAAESFQGDLSNPTEVARLAAQIGALDVLVAVSDPAGAPDLDWRRSLDAALSSAVLVTRAVLQKMAKKAGRIVLIGPARGPLHQDDGEKHRSGVATIADLVRGLTHELGTQGIAINAIAPGWIASQTLGVAERLAACNSPMGRAGRADEVGSLAAYLVSPLAGYLSGQVISLDGGAGSSHISSDRKPNS